MDQDPQVPLDPHAEIPKPPAAPPASTPAPTVPKKDTSDLPRAGAIDISKILLPKKEGQSPQSAQRINAGILLEQEQNATLRPAAPPASPTPAVAKPTPVKAEESTTPSLQTYRGDIEQVVQNKNVSVVSIAAAEAGRRGESGGITTMPAPQAKDNSFLIRMLFFFFF